MSQEQDRQKIISLIENILEDIKSSVVDVESLSLEVIAHGLPSKNIINSAPNGDRIFTVRYTHIPTLQAFNKRYADLQREYNGEYVVPKFTGER